MHELSAFVQQGGTSLQQKLELLESAFKQKEKEGQTIVEVRKSLESAGLTTEARFGTLAQWAQMFEGHLGQLRQEQHGLTVFVHQLRHTVCLFDPKLDYLHSIVSDHQRGLDKICDSIQDLNILLTRAV